MSKLSRTVAFIDTGTPANARFVSLGPFPIGTRVKAIIVSGGIIEASAVGVRDQAPIVHFGIFSAAPTSDTAFFASQLLLPSVGIASGQGLVFPGMVGIQEPLAITGDAWSAPTPASSGGETSRVSVPVQRLPIDAVLDGEDRICGFRFYMNTDQFVGMVAVEIDDSH